MASLDIDPHRDTGLIVDVVLPVLVPGDGQARQSLRPRQFHLADAGLPRAQVARLALGARTFRCRSHADLSGCRASYGTAHGPYLEGVFLAIGQTGHNVGGGPRCASGDVGPFVPELIPGFVPVLEPGNRPWNAGQAPTKLHLPVARNGRKARGHRRWRSNDRHGPGVGSDAVTKVIDGADGEGVSPRSGQRRDVKRWWNCLDPRPPIVPRSACTDNRQWSEDRQSVPTPEARRSRQSARPRSSGFHRRPLSPPPESRNPCAGGPTPLMFTPRTAKVWCTSFDKPVTKWDVVATVLPSISLQPRMRCTKTAPLSLPPYQSAPTNKVGSNTVSPNTVSPNTVFPTTATDHPNWSSLLPAGPGTLAVQYYRPSRRPAR